MRILIVLPQQERATGNEVTAARHRDGLIALGHQVALVRVRPDDGPLLRAQTLNFVPDVVHLLHAYRSGRPWLASGMESLPYVVTLTGTDINHGISTPEEGPVIRRVLSGAGRVVALNAQTRDRVQQEIPSLAGRIVCLPPGILLGSAPSPLYRTDLAAPGETLFLHPAGIRPVKGNRELLDLFAPLAADGLPFVVAFCGPLLDEDYSVAFLAALAECPWARYLGVIPPAAMPALMQLADVILNNSESEGLPNALLEAAVLGLPMLVHNIPGNSAIVEAGVNGLLFDDPRSFVSAARLLCADPARRAQLATPRRDDYSPARESAALSDLYRAVLTEREIGV